jgi:hypothetical protein
MGKDTRHRTLDARKKRIVFPVCRVPSVVRLKIKGKRRKEIEKNEDNIIPDKKRIHSDLPE